MDAVIPSPNRFHTIRTDFGRRAPASGQGIYGNGYDHFGLDFGGAFRVGISENAAREKSNDCIAATPQRTGVALARVCRRILPRARSGRRASMFSAVDQPGQYFILIRWHPGYMSAPHWYETDRLCIVLSGTWYVASGEDFAPDATVPAPGRLFRAPGRRDAPL